MEHVVDYLFEVGPTSGEYPLSFTEIQNWKAATGVVLNEFEATALVMLSRAFMDMKSKAIETTCKSPVSELKGQEYKGQARALMQARVQKEKQRQ